MFFIDIHLRRPDNLTDSQPGLLRSHGLRWSHDCHVHVYDFNAFEFWHTTSWYKTTSQHPKAFFCADADAACTGTDLVAYHINTDNFRDYLQGCAYSITADRHAISRSYYSSDYVSHDDPDVDSDSAAFNEAIIMSVDPSKCVPDSRPNYIAIENSNG